MKTFAFIGSDKNAGKTTALLHIYNKLLSKGKIVCLASTGINGEPVDTFEGHPKPEIRVRKDSFFVSTEEHCRVGKSNYEILHCFTGPEFSKPYWLCKCTDDFQLILEGPNSRSEIERMKTHIQHLIPSTTLLIDGSVDRQFLGKPSICNGFYFSILLTDRFDQMEQSRRLVQPLSFPRIAAEIETAIQEHREPLTKSILFDQQLNPCYEGDAIPFLDEQLLSAIRKVKDKPMTVYLNGALSRSLSEQIAEYRNLHVVLDNFTLYQNISDPLEKRFFPDISLLQPLRVLAVFLRHETESKQLKDTLNLPDDIPVYDLFES